jgi:tryptophan synthase alpha chain
MTSSLGGTRLTEAIRRANDEGRAALVLYATAGYPDADTSVDIAVAAIDAGADVLEIGLPYSDPLADGATVQHASTVARANGATLDGSIALIGRIHAARPETPLVTMGYCNQVLGGKDGATVLRRLSDAGVSGFILADITPDESAEVEAEAAQLGIGLVYLVAPTTTAERLPYVTGRSQGFVYAVALTGVTGARSDLMPGLKRFLRSVGKVSPVPVAVGFGISKPAHVRQLARVVDGVVSASALIDALGPEGTDIAAMTALARSLRKATVRA